MEDGAFSRGREIINAEGSIVFVGNIDRGAAAIVKHMRELTDFNYDKEEA